MTGIGQSAKHCVMSLYKGRGSKSIRFNLVNTKNHGKELGECLLSLHKWTQQ